MTRLIGKAGSAGLLIFALGCTADSGGRDVRRDDPILGIGARPANQSAAVVSSTPVGGTQGPPTPAYRPQAPLTSATPTSSGSGNGGFQPLQNGNDLRIGSGAAAPVPANNAPPAAQPVAGVTAVPPPGAPTTAPATPIGMTAPTGNLDQAYAAVMDRKPLWHKMTFNSQTGEFTFQMSVPSKLNTAASQNVEASATTQADAIRRTLEQLGN